MDALRERTTLAACTDDELIEAINRGQVEDGLAVLQARYGSKVRHFVRGIVKDEFLAQDVAQETFPRPVTSLISVGAGSEIDLLDQVFTDASNRDLETEEFMSAFEAAVRELPEPYRNVFRECVISGRSYQEVGDEFGIPTGTVAIRIMRARKRLFAALSPHLDRLRRPPACVQ